MLTGDWLYMQSFQMALEERNFRILDILIDLTQKMVEGELIQLAKIGRIDVTEEDALRLATYKTACLFSGCARLGAVLGGLEGKEEQALADYGRYAGLAFQLVDDLLDFTASAQQLGKPVLSDLKEGKVTLPLIYAMENGHRDAREMVARVLAEKEFNSVRPETIVSLVHESGALDRARNLAQDYAQRAKACLNGRRRFRILIARSPRCRISSSNARTNRATRHAAVQTGLSRTLRPESRPARFSFAEIPPHLRNAPPRRHRCEGGLSSPEPASDEDILRVHTAGLGAQTEDRHAHRQRRDETGSAVFDRNWSRQCGWPRADRFSRGNARCATGSVRI